MGSFAMGFNQAFFLLVLTSMLFQMVMCKPQEKSVKGSLVRKERAQDNDDQGRNGGASNYQAIQEARKAGGGAGAGNKKKATATRTEKLDTSYVVYEVVRHGALKYVK